MLLSLISLFLVPLSAAAPVADNQTPSHTLQARSMSCSHIFGHDMGAGDCANALEVMYAEPRVLRHPDTGLPVPIAGIFSRTSTDARFRLPQRFVAGSCTILVDMANIHGSVATSWAFAAAGAHGVVQRCVLRHGNGGIDSRFGFDTTVLSPATMQRSMQQFWQTCVGIMEDYQQRFVLGTQCVRPDLDDAVAAWARAGGKPDEEE